MNGLHIKVYFPSYLLEQEMVALHSFLMNPYICAKMSSIITTFDVKIIYLTLYTSINSDAKLVYPYFYLNVPLVSEIFLFMIGESTSAFL